MPVGSELAVHFYAECALEQAALLLITSWQKDNKVCFLRMEGKLFGDAYRFKKKVQEKIQNIIEI